MKVTIEDINETRKKLLVSIPAEEIEAEDRKLIKEFSKIARIPGFRKGKAPPRLIRQRFARELEERLDQELVSHAYEEAVKEAAMDIYSVLKLEKNSIKEGEDGEISLLVDVNPEFNLPEYEGIPTEVASTEVTDEEVEETLETIRKQRANYNVVERAAKKGDFVKVSYEGKTADGLIADLLPDHPIWGKQDNSWESVGAEESVGVKAVVEGLEGMKAGDSKEVEMEFPEDFEISELAGKKAIYAMEAHEVREQVLPELNEAFLKSMRVESPEQLRAQIHDDIKTRKERQQRSEQRMQITKALNERIEFPLPETALEMETEAIMREIMEENLQRGLPESELEAHKEEIFENARRRAAERVKMTLLLQRIGKEADIEIENSDMQRYIMTEAMRTRKKTAQLVKELEKDQDRVRAAKRSILVNKTLDFLVEKSAVTIKNN